MAASTARNNHFVPHLRHFGVMQLAPNYSASFTRMYTSVTEATGATGLFAYNNVTIPHFTCHICTFLQSKLPGTCLTFKTEQKQIQHSQKKAEHKFLAYTNQQESFRGREKLDKARVMLPNSDTVREILVAI